MAIPDFQTLMLPVLQLAGAGELEIADAIETLAGKFALSEEERSALLPSGRQTDIRKSRPLGEKLSRQSGAD